MDIKHLDRGNIAIRFITKISDVLNRTGWTHPPEILIKGNDCVVNKISVNLPHVKRAKPMKSQQAQKIARRAGDAWQFWTERNGEREGRLLPSSGTLMAIKKKKSTGIPQTTELQWTAS